MASKPNEVRESRPHTTVIVGANVYRHRVLRVPKLSQQGLADAAGIALETVRLLERNRLGGAQLNPQLDTIDKIADALGVDPSALFQQSAMPSFLTGRRRHLSVVAGTGEDLPTKG